MGNKTFKVLQRETVTMTPNKTQDVKPGQTIIVDLPYNSKCDLSELASEGAGAARICGALDRRDIHAVVTRQSRGGHARFERGVGRRDTAGGRTPRRQELFRSVANAVTLAFWDR